MIGPSKGLDDYRDAQVAPVVSLTWAGRTWRLSTRALTGPDVHIDPGLIEAPDLDDEISLESGGDIGVSVSFAAVLPATSVVALVATGYDLFDARAEVAIVWHRDGTLLHGWAAREVRADGYLTEPDHQQPSQPPGYLSATVEDSPYRVQRPLCPWSWAVSSSTWSGSPEQDARYPLVVGRPDPSAAGGGPPAPVVQQTGTPTNLTALVSVGWCAASTVTLLDSLGGSDVLDITYTTDSLGQLCAVVDLTGSAVDVADGTTYTTAWTAGPALAPQGGYGPLQVASYLLSIGGAAIDQAEWARVGALLRLPMGGYLDDPESEAWEVARELLAGLPVTMRRAREGWAPVLLDPHLARQTVAATWQEEGPYRRASGWMATGDKRVARVEVSSEAGEISAGYGHARDAGLPHAWVRHLPRLSEAGASSSWSWSQTTDYRLLAWATRIGALGWEASAWQVPPQWGRVRAGEWVYLSDSKQYALVQRRTLTDGVWDYTLVRPRGR